ncbi:MAG: hypothetical protein JKY56_14360 [Kofleriaceae bacterium]|nr:hypothetical protein [Kofleriaceae bacterium]
MPGGGALGRSVGRRLDGAGRAVAGALGIGGALLTRALGGTTGGPGREALGREALGRDTPGCGVARRDNGGVGPGGVGAGWS